MVVSAELSRTAVEPGPGLAAAAEVHAAIERGAGFLAGRQQPDGSWVGDYGGPMFLLPMYVGACHVTGHAIASDRRGPMVRYLRHVQLRDGSIGLHAEAERGCMFTSSLCYVALRLLGVADDDPDAARLRRWIHDNGTPLGAASWGKFMLAVLDLYDYDGLHPLTPELWLLPYAVPFHPGRMWCHCRQVYLPMAYLYGARARRPADGFTRALRAELYPMPYGSIRFADHRDTRCPADSIYPPHPALSLVNRATGLYERLPVPALRRAAQRRLLEHIEYEDRATGHVRIGPVNAVLNTLVHHFAGSDAETMRRSFEALDAYLWQGHDGLKMQGYNSTALWDTAFAAQALLASPAAGAHDATLRRAHDYIRDNQVVDELPDRARHHRHPCRGGWPFSSRRHGWPITDCTAEGLKSALALEGRVERPVPEPLLRAAVELLLGFQNPGGGWSTYELQRAGGWLEALNPSLVFADIMVDYPHVECTSACIQALAAARARLPGAYERRIERAIARGARFIRAEQRGDGSWEGSWAVCFTYGGWFGSWGLRAAGAPPEDPAIQRAAAFLERHQLPDGGFGEHHESCVQRRYISLPAGHVVNTAWALMTLYAAGRATSRAAHRAARFLLDSQQPDGDWPRQQMIGVFNRTSLINYANYRRYFPVWALSLYRRSNP